MARKKLSSDEVQDVLKGVHRVLKNRGVEQPVHVRFDAASTGLCWRRVCTTLPDGSVECHWEQVPC